MASPVNIRVMAAIPFPPLVVGGAPVKVTKANGIWTISLDVGSLGATVPLIGSYATDFLLMWDSIALTYSKVSLSNLGIGSARLQRAQSAATSTVIAVAGNDQIINFDSTSAAMTCTLPASASRNGVPLTFKDSGGDAGAETHNLTITPNGAETVDGLTSVKVNTNYGEITLRPYSDGVNTGWAIA